VSAPGTGTVWEQLALPRLIKSADADVLFAPAYTAPLRCPVPFVLMVHDVSFAAHPEWFSWREGLRRRLITRASARRAARVLTQSDFTKREAVRYLSLDQSRVDVIYLGTTTLRTNAPREPLVLYVGSLFNRRHVPALIEGFARLAARHPTARLEIVGDNRTTPVIDVDALIARSGVADRIRARQYVSDAELSALYARASAFAFLSEYEGFGLTPLEAMAAGIPVVVLDTEIAREIYGPAAEYVARPDPALIAAALERLLVSDEERARLIEAGAAQVGRYSWDECARRTLQVLLACAR
jgi:glycosyltransferase involved in cell wall biosynthesis